MMSCQASFHGLSGHLHVFLGEGKELLLGGDGNVLKLDNGNGCLTLCGCAQSFSRVCFVM